MKNPGEMHVKPRCDSLRGAFLVGANVVIWRLLLMDEPMLTASLIHHLSIVPDFRQA